MNGDRGAPQIALIHAVYVAMAPVEAAFQRLWPAAGRMNLVDDGLPAALERDGSMTASLRERIHRLADHAVLAGADGVLFTCSAFGEAIDAAAARLSVPVLKPNEPMFQAALQQGMRIGMVATFAASVASMESEFRQLASQLTREGRVPASIDTVCVPEALAAAKRGDVATHDRLVAEAATGLRHCDAIMLAHFSTASALAAVQQSVDRPVLTAPDAAVARLKSLLQAGRS